MSGTDAVAEPVLDERGGLLMGQGICAGGAGRLHIELLQYLDREREVGATQDRSGLLVFLCLLRLCGDGVKEDVGIDKGHERPSA